MVFVANAVLAVDLWNEPHNSAEIFPTMPNNDIARIRN